MSAPRPSAVGWQSVRVFISSTFRDMHAERDHLVKVVFPRLRAALLKDHIHLEDIDLRWGLTQEESDNDQVLAACLREIETCRPFFVGILGQRYGFVPTRLANDVLSRYGWVQSQTRRSITELEMLHGVINDPAMHSRAIFCLRNDQYLSEVPTDRLDVYREGPTPQERSDLSPQQAQAAADERINRLEALKDRLRALEGASLLDGYPCRWDSQAVDPSTAQAGRLVGLEGFGHWVAQRLEESIRAAPELAEHFAAMARQAPDPHGLAREDDYHQQFIQSRMRIYIGREEIHRQLRDYAHGERDNPLLLVGPPGSGKSSALARLAGELADEADLVFAHFVGASPTSTRLRDLLRRLCLELRETFAFTDTFCEPRQKPQSRPADVPQETPALVVRLRDFLARIPAGRHVLLVIDAINMLDPADRAETLDWLPAILPPTVRAVLSSTSQDPVGQRIVRQAASRGLGRLDVSELTDQERREIVRQVPLLSAKRLDDHQIGLLLANPETRNPLYLLAALEELKGFGSYERLTDRIAAFPHPGMDASALARAGFKPAPADNLSGDVQVFLQVVQRLERECGSHLVRRVLSLLAVSRHGLSEQELLDLTGTDGAGAPSRQEEAEQVFGLLAQLRPHLQHRGELLSFYHMSFLAAVRTWYAQHEEQSARPLHADLARYFLRVARPAEGRWDDRAIHALSELPLHQLRAGLWDELEKTLTDLRFVEAKSRAGMPYDLLGDYGSAGEEARRLERAWPAAGLESFIRRHVHLLVAHPDLCLQQACNEPASPALNLQAEEALREDRPPRPWVRRINRPDQADPCLATLEDSSAQALACDPKGRWLATAGIGVHLWDLAAGVKIAALGERNFAAACAFSRDGDLLAATYPSGQVCVWETTTRTQKLDEHPGGALGACAFSPTDGMLAVGGMGTSRLYLYDLRRKSLIARAGLAGPLNAVAFSADGRRIFAAVGQAIQVLDAETARMLATLQKHQKAVTCLALSPDGRRLLTGSADRTLRLWDADNLQALATYAGGREPLRCCAWAPDNEHFVSGSRTLEMFESHSGLLCLWHVGSNEPAVQLDGHPGGVDACGFWAVGRLISSCSQGVKIWDMARVSGYRAPGHLTTVRGLAYDPAGLRVASAAHDGRIILWDAATGRRVSSLVSHTDRADGCAFLPGGQDLISAGREGVVKRWARDRIVWQADLGEPVQACLVTPDGSRVVAILYRGADVLDSDSGDYVMQVTCETGNIEAWDLSADGTRLALGGEELTTVFDLRTGEQTVRVEMVGQVMGCRFSPDARLVATSSGKMSNQAITSGNLAIIDVDDGDDAWLFKADECDQEQIGCAFLGDGRRLVTSSFDSTLRLWDLPSRRQIVALPKACLKGRMMTSTPDARWVLSAARDWLLVLDPATGQTVARYPIGELTSLAGDAPPGRAVAGEASGRVHLLDLQHLVSGPAVVTATKLYLHRSRQFEPEPSIRCGWCGRRSQAQAGALQAIAGFAAAAGRKPGDFSCLLLPPEAWNDPAMNSTCPPCGRAVKYNPFLVDASLRLE